jgi:hypothetical protein
LRFVIRASIIALFSLLSGCATPEVKAPCGPLNAYAADDCGDAKPANAAFDAALKR